MTGLRMERPNLEGLGEIILSEGYQLKTYDKGDETAWIEIVKETFPSADNEWNTERFQRDFLDCPQFRSDSLFFVTYEGKSVGTTCAWTDSPDEKKKGILHMVAVLPEYQGNKLGYVLCLSALHFFRENGFEYVKLNTHDFRLPAVKTYLNLGFVPEYIDDNSKKAWSIVFMNLGSKK
jgi:mycothiol synthase